MNHVETAPMNRPRILALVACVALSGFAGCGGGNDKEDAEEAVRQIVEASGGKDVKKFCGLATQRLLEELTGAKGDEAKEACEKQPPPRRAADYKLDRIVRTQVDGDKATVTVELRSSGGQKRPQVFPLKKEDGEFKLRAARE